MKVFYIVGLEHSGTTLTDHLLSTHSNILGLGEISSFFSPQYMKYIVNKWGWAPDFSLCSCGRDWKQCEFWGNIADLCGLNSNDSMINKYKKLFSYVKKYRGDEAVIVDSSKSINTLDMLFEGGSKLGILPTDILVIFAIKDARNFLVSYLNRRVKRRNLISIFRGYNYWIGANKKILDYLYTKNIDFYLNLYENLCSDPVFFMNRQLARFGSIDQVTEVDIKNNSSHIFMGNKNFIMRKRDRIIYDSRWYHDDVINFVYLLHGKARAFNKYIHSLQKRPIATISDKV